MTMKTPDIIKKGLESCNKGWQYCRECPYYTVGCDIVLCGDALEYIKQLEADNAQQARCIENLSDKLNAANDEMAKLQAERDAMISDFEQYDELPCALCEHYSKEESEIPCKFCKNLATPTDEDKVSQWEWRGVQKEDGNV